MENPKSTKQSKSKSASTASLSPAARRIASLVEEFADGSQAQFAREIGCAQPVISRIVNGKQQPGRELLEKISRRFKKISKTDLLALLGESAPRVLRNFVPILSRLIPGHPDDHRDQIGDKFLELPANVYRSSRYAILAETCFTHDMELERQFRRGEHLIIETEVSPDVRVVEGRFCVVRSHDKKKQESLELLKSRLHGDGKSSHLTFPSKKTETQQYQGRELRVIHLREPQSGKKTNRKLKPDANESTPPPQILGSVVYSCQSF